MAENTIQPTAPQSISMSGGGTLFGSFVNLIGQFMAMDEADKQNKIQRDFTRELTQTNMNFAREQMATQQQYNINAWNLQNAYNTPQAQVNRLSQAGFNPSLFGGENSAGAIGSSSPVGGQMIDTTKPNMSPEIMSKAFSQFGEMIGKALDEIPLLREKKETEKSQQRLFDAQGNMYNAQGKRFDAETEQMLTNLGWSREANEYLKQNGFGFYSDPLNPFDMRLTKDATHTKYTKLEQKYDPFAFLNAWERIGGLNASLTRYDRDISEKDIDIAIKGIEKNIREAQWLDPESRKGLVKMPWQQFKNAIAEQKEILSRCSLLKQQQQYFHSLTGYYNVLTDNEIMLYPYKANKLNAEAQFIYSQDKNQPFVRNVLMKQAHYFESMEFLNNVKALETWNGEWNRHGKLYFQIKDWLTVGKIGVDVLNGLSQAYYFSGEGTNKWMNVFNPIQKLGGSLIMPQNSGSFDMTPFTINGFNNLRNPQ